MIKTQQFPSAVDDGGHRPDATPRFGPLLAQAWHAKYVADGQQELAMAHEGVLIRASDAGNCARALSYKIRRRMAVAENERRLAADGEEGAEVELVEVDEYSNPPTMADEWRMGIGSMVHEAIQEVLPVAYPGAEVEALVLRPAEPGISMHVDVILTYQADDDPTVTDEEQAGGSPDLRKVAIEIKTINGTGFKRSVGADRGGPQGPRNNAVLQGALAAYEADCDELVVLYLALELISPSLAQRYGIDELGKFVAEWTYDRAQIKELAEREHKRMKAVLTLVEQGELAPRAIPDPEIPHGHRITNPATGEWKVEQDGQLVNIGSTWHCGYCWDQDRCVADKAAGR